MEIAQLQAKAERLSQLRSAISEKEQEVKEALETLKAERDALQEELLADMAATNLATIKLATGENYIRAVRKGIAIKSLPHALKWATEHHAVKIDSVQLAQQLKDAAELPSCFERTETAYISIRNPKK